jgi:hypothetical protein
MALCSIQGISLEVTIVLQDQEYCFAHIGIHALGQIMILILQTEKSRYLQQMTEPVELVFYSK